MVSVVHVESSSSQNVNPSITALKEGASGESVQVLLSDSSSFFVPPHAVIDFQLKVGLEVVEELKQRLEASHELLRAKQKAAELLARREHSRFELYNKLQKRQFSHDAIRTVLDEFQRLELLNDERFAEMWVRNRIRRKAEGPVKIKSALKNKGVDNTIIEDVVNREYDVEEQHYALEQATEKILKKSHGNRVKFIRMLLNRGFSLKQIKNYSINKFFQYYDNLR